VQGEAQHQFPKACSLGNTDNVRSVWLGNNGSLQADAWQTCTLSHMFPEKDSGKLTPTGTN
jgi:hypothetical protein